MPPISFHLYGNIFPPRGPQPPVMADDKRFFTFIEPITQVFTKSLCLSILVCVISIMNKAIVALSLLVAGSSAFVPAVQNRQGTFLLSSVDDKTEVREYFNTEGFNRWNKIYSESDEVNSVQLDIRTGHDQTIQKILSWVQADGDIKGKTVCDCGCGVGSLAIPLAQMGEYISKKLNKLDTLD